MPTVPEELDVFLVPHRYMMELLEDVNILLERHIENSDDFFSLLQKLIMTFNAFQTHEEIENRYILQALIPRISENVKTSLENEIHSVNQVNDMLSLLKLASHSLENWPHYGKQLKEGILAFKVDFIPHMKGEEEILLPLLIENFTVDELKKMTCEVLKMHNLEKSNKAEDNVEVNLISLPPEILLEILSYLGPLDLCRLSSLHSHLYKLSFDGSLWNYIHPIQWSFGRWQFFYPWPQDQEVLLCELDEKAKELLEEERCCIEARILDGLVSSLLPKIGIFVEALDLSHSRRVTSKLVNKMISFCPYLKYLDISHTAITDSAFESFSQVKRQRLEYLNLSGCSMVTDTTLIHIAKATMPSYGVNWSVKDNQAKYDQQAFLKYLILAGCHQITDTGLRTFSSRSGFPFLKYLELSGLSRISTSGLNELVIVCPQLKGNGLFYCDNLENGPHSSEANGCQHISGSQCCQNLFQS